MEACEMTCTHDNFYCKCDVNRISKEPGEPIAYYSVDMQIHCSDCGQKMEFVGLPLGHSPYRPTVSMDGLKASFPMVPEGGKVPEGLASLSVKMTDLRQ